MHVVSTGVQLYTIEVVVGMLHVLSLWLLLGCVRIVLIRILYSLFLDERDMYHYLL